MDKLGDILPWLMGLIATVLSMMATYIFRAERKAALDTLAKSNEHLEKIEEHIREQNKVITTLETKMEGLETSNSELWSMFNQAVRDLNQLIGRTSHG